MISFKLNKLNNYFLNNLILSLIGIYFSYFYFGEKLFFYSNYILSNILSSCFYITIIVVILYAIIDYTLKILSQKKLKIFFDAVIFSLILYITYHFIIRFSDLSYYEIYRLFFGSKNIYSQTIFYFYPFFVGILIFVLVNSESLKKINKFIFVLLIIFNIFSIHRLTAIYLDSEKYLVKNDYSSFKTQKKTKLNSNKKIIFLLFDELDQKFFMKHYDQLPSLKKLHKTSYTNDSFFTPANYTRESIPAILTGNSIKEKIIIKKDNISFLNLKNETIDFNFENSIFNDLKKRNLSSSIYGAFLPYCKIFKIDICFDKINFQVNYINLSDALKIFLEVTFFEKVLDKIFDVNVDYFYPLLENNLAKFMINNSKNFVNTNTNLVYVHYTFPHLPLQANDLIDNKNNLIGLSDYEKNLYLVDKTISNIENITQEYKNSLLIITSDHWFRKPYIKIRNKEAYPVVFISKIIGDDQFFLDVDSKNASSIKDLIIDYLDGNVKSNYDIKSFFDNKKNHKTYVRFFSD